jgi:hypothetical protein
LRAGVDRIRVTRDADLLADVLAPDHFDPRHSLRTESHRETIKIPGGSQVLQRRTELTVITAERTSGVQIPLPTVLGALILKAAAWVEDGRAPERHLQDAVLLVSLIGDPLVEREALKGTDRKRLNKLNETLGESGAGHWEMLGNRANDALTKWQLLLEA